MPDSDCWLVAVAGFALLVVEGVVARREVARSDDGGEVAVAARSEVGVGGRMVDSRSVVTALFDEVECHLECKIQSYEKDFNV